MLLHQFRTIGCRPSASSSKYVDVVLNAAVSWSACTVAFSRTRPNTKWTYRLCRHGACVCGFMESGIISQDASKDATLIVLAVAAFLQTIFAGRMIRSCSLHRQHFLRKTKRCLTSIRRACVRSTPSDDERLVLERANQLHLEMTRIFVRYSCALLCTGFALLQWRVARDVSLTTSSLVQGTMLSGLGVFIFIDSCPAILTVGRLNAFYVLVSLCATVSLSPWHVQLDRVVLMELSFLAWSNSCGGDCPHPCIGCRLQSASRAAGVDPCKYDISPRCQCCCGSQWLHCNRLCIGGSPAAGEKPRGAQSPIWEDDSRL